MDVRAVLKRVPDRLRAAFGSRFRQVILFGSEATGRSEPDSDIDLMVLLDGPVELWRDIRTGVEALYPLQLEIPDRPIRALPADILDYQAGEFALYRNVRREGVTL